MVRKLILASLLLVTGVVGAATPSDSVARLNKLYADFWEDNLKMNPVGATFAGDPRYNAELPNFLSKDFEDANRAFEKKYLDAAKAIGPAGLTGQDRLSYDIFTLNRESELEELKFPRPACCPLTSSTTSPTCSPSSGRARAVSRSRP